MDPTSTIPRDIRTKNQKKRLRKKLKKQAEKNEAQAVAGGSTHSNNDNEKEMKNQEQKVVVEGDGLIGDKPRILRGLEFLEPAPPKPKRVSAERRPKRTTADPNTPIKLASRHSPWTILTLQKQIAKIQAIIAIQDAVKSNCTTCSITLETELGTKATNTQSSKK